MKNNAQNKFCLTVLNGEGNKMQRFFDDEKLAESFCKRVVAFYQNVSDKYRGDFCFVDYISVDKVSVMNSEVVEVIDYIYYLDGEKIRVRSMNRA